MEDSKRFSTSSHSLCSGSISSYLSELARCLSNVSRAIVIRNKALLPRDSFRSHPLSDENSSEILTEALYERRRKREKGGNIEPCFYFNPESRILVNTGAGFSSYSLSVRFSWYRSFWKPFVIISLDLRTPRTK